MEGTQKEIDGHCDTSSLHPLEAANIAALKTLREIPIKLDLLLGKNEEPKVDKELKTQKSVILANSERKYILPSMAGPETTDATETMDEIPITGKEHQKCSRNSKVKHTASRKESLSSVCEEFLKVLESSLKTYHEVATSFMRNDELEDYEALKTMENAHSLVENAQNSVEEEKSHKMSPNPTTSDQCMSPFQSLDQFIDADAVAKKYVSEIPANFNRYCELEDYEARKTLENAHSLVENVQHPIEGEKSQKMNTCPTTGDQPMPQFQSLDQFIEVDAVAKKYFSKIPENFIQSLSDGGKLRQSIRSGLETTIKL